MTPPTEPTAPAARSTRDPGAADTGPPATVVLVRHGRTALTESGRFSGRDAAHDPELSEAGREDARRVAAALAGLGRPGSLLPGVGPLDAVVASPLARAHGTARAVADAAGLPVAVDPGWAEIGFGAWEGLTLPEVAAGWPDLLRGWQGSATATPPGGESLDDLQVRVRGALSRVVDAHPGRVVAVVTHTTPVRAVVRDVLDAGPATLWRLRVEPAAVTVVRYWQDGGCEVAATNATAHLTDAVRLAS